MCTSGRRSWTRRPTSGSLEHILAWMTREGRSVRDGGIRSWHGEWCSIEIGQIVGLAHTASSSRNEQACCSMNDSNLWSDRVRVLAASESPC